MSELVVSLRHTGPKGEQWREFRLAATPPAADPLAETEEACKLLRDAMRVMREGDTDGDAPDA